MNAPIVRQWPLGFVLAGVALGLAAVLFWPRGFVSATADQYETLIDALGQHGTMLERVPEGTKEGELGFIATTAEAVDAAASSNARADTPVVYKGFLTMADQEPRIDRRPVYVVQLTGLTLPPFGGTQDPDRIHHELIVFVDASTGLELLSQTVR